MLVMVGNDFAVTSHSRGPVFITGVVIAQRPVHPHSHSRFQRLIQGISHKNMPEAQPSAWSHVNYPGIGGFFNDRVGRFVRNPVYVSDNAGPYGAPHDRCNFKEIATFRA